MKPEKKTFVILTPGFPASETDSTCLPMQQQFVKALKQQDASLNIIVLSFQYPYAVQTYSWFGVTVMSFNGQNKGGLARLLLRRKINAALQKISHSSNIVGLLSFWYNECAWVGKKFAAKNKLKHFCWILGQDARANNHYPRRLNLPAAETIALSGFLQTEFKNNHGITPAFVIPPGIDTNLFADGIQEKDIHLMAAGSLIPLKQFEIFIELVAAIKEQVPGIKAVLTGDGPEMERLKKLVAKHDLQSHLLLTGELAYPEVLQWMQRTKTFIHPSSYEGFSGVCLEALAAGAQVVSFCKPMKQDIENWKIVNNKEEMKKQASELLLNADSTVAKSIPLTIDDTANKMLMLFER
ncbi:MAG: glycosyltransferase family 4 protein [Ferruginibacter sp.]|nr:glycosyltransferase family 4 protein [Ferruginibacter sp.]